LKAVWFNEGIRVSRYSGEAAMAGVESEQAARLEQYRDYLRLLARLQLPAAVQGKVDASDIVQLTMLRAFEKIGQLRGTSEAELAGWLRQILATVLANAIRDLGRQKRDAALERSIEAALDHSSACLENWLAAGHSSPSEQAQRNEQVVRLAQGLTALPDLQREVLVLRHCQGWSLEAIGQHMGKSRAAVASLLRRGLAQLREFLQEKG
jgi:RNA polymerase sigma-70 factor (ECF subfamily)